MSDIGIEDNYVIDHSFWDEMDTGNNYEQYNVENTGVYEHKPNLQFQTILALQQLGLIISVVLMVATIFMAMISLEKIWNLALEYFIKRFGEENVEDAEDPAALVGTFKRYKNKENSRDNTQHYFQH